MESVCDQFLVATIGWFEEFARRNVERAVMEGGDVTAALSDAELGRIKAELKDLIGRAEGLVKNHVGLGNHWIHRQKGAIPGDVITNAVRYATRGNNPPEILDSPVRSLTAHVGTLIMKYGFEKGTRNPPEAGRWDPAYRYALTWSGNMIAAAKAYGDLSEKLIEARQQFHHLEETKRQAQAKARWDKA